MNGGTLKLLKVMKYLKEHGYDFGQKCFSDFNVYNVTLLQ